MKQLYPLDFTKLRKKHEKKIENSLMEKLNNIFKSKLLVKKPAVIPSSNVTS